MKFFTKTSAFTLIEIIIVVTIIGLLALISTQTSIFQVWIKQQSEIESNKIINGFEVVRNNALLWKAIWAQVELPSQWKITFDTNANTTTTQYFTWSWNTYKDITFKPGFSIDEIYCGDQIESSTGGLLGQTFDIQMDSKNLSFSWCLDTDYNKVFIKTNFQWFSNTIWINGLNRLIEYK